MEKYESTTVRRCARVLAMIVGISLLSACAANEQGDKESNLVGTLSGGGSTAQAVAQDTWISHIQRNNSRVTIEYDPAGSGAGKVQFLAGAFSYAASDAALSDEEAQSGSPRCAAGSEAINLPVYVSPLVLIFNVDGVERLQLDAAAVAGIFNGSIERWNDPALVALNPDAELPDERVVAVYRSDDSGTTENFTDYLHQAAPAEWPDEPSNTFPYSGEGAQGNSGVVNAVGTGSNTIGYVDASRAEGKSVASLKVGGSFVDYSPEAAAAIVDASPLLERENGSDIVVAVDRASTAAGVYPLVLVSYVIACQTYADAGEAVLVKAFLEHVASPEGQSDAAESTGSAPLSESFTDRVLDAVRTIG
ncbi:phosphate transport system substrate-binding protein [Mycetocola sp. CAN_C7]|uniref:phosphate ABC transporter substrate-binding protein PstS n=1 Tax=Mycetocola sp. CAN_C7 TaxID=2787724 RepID=UPI001A1ED4EB